MFANTLGREAEVGIRSSHTILGALSIVRNLWKGPEEQYLEMLGHPLYRCHRIGRYPVQRHLEKAGQ
jgi:hypothetical protein